MARYYNIGQNCFENDDFRFDKKLITLVKLEPTLWDDRLSEYNDIKLNESKWRNIADKLTDMNPLQTVITADLLKSKWEKLYNYYIRLKRREFEYGSIILPKTTSRTLYNHLKFLDKSDFLQTLQQDFIHRSTHLKSVILRVVGTDGREADVSSVFSWNSNYSELSNNANEFQNTSNSPQLIQNICDKTKQVSNIKLKSNNTEDILLQKLLDSLMKPQDIYHIFGEYVAAELRNLHSNKNRNKLKRLIQQAILHISELDDAANNINENTENNFSYA